MWSLTLFWLPSLNDGADTSDTGYIGKRLECVSSIGREARALDLQTYFLDLGLCLPLHLMFAGQRLVCGLSCVLVRFLPSHSRHQTGSIPDYQTSS